MSKSSKRMHAMTTVGFDSFNNMPYDKFSSRAENYDYGGVYYIHPPQPPPPYHSYMPSSYYYAVNGGFPALPPTNGQYMSIERSNHSKRAELPKLKDTKLKKNDKTTDVKDKNTKGRKNDKFGDKVSKKAKENSKGMFPILKRISNGIVHGLETFFYKLGMLVSCHPKKTIALCTVISCLLGIGLVKLKLDRDLDGWLIPLDSRIHTDKEWVASHITFDLRIVQMIVENDNILTKDSLLAMYDLYAASLEIRVDGVGLSDICTNILGNCYITSILDLWDYDKTVIEALTDEEIQEEIKTSELNPRYYTEFDAARILGGRTVALAGETVGAKATLMAWYLSPNSTNKDSVLKFEKKMIELAKNGVPGLKDVHVQTLDSFQDEYFDFVINDLFLIIFSCPAIFFYMIIAVGKPNLMDHGILHTCCDEAENQSANARFLQRLFVIFGFRRDFRDLLLPAGTTVLEKWLPVEAVRVTDSCREPRQEAESRGQSLQKPFIIYKPNITDGLCKKRKLADWFIPCDNSNGTMVFLLDSFSHLAHMFGA